MKSPKSSNSSSSKALVVVAAKTAARKDRRTFWMLAPDPDHFSLRKNCDKESFPFKRIDTERRRKDA